MLDKQYSYRVFQPKTFSEDNTDVFSNNLWEMSDVVEDLGENVSVANISASINKLSVSYENPLNQELYWEDITFTGSKTMTMERLIFKFKIDYDYGTDYNTTWKVILGDFIDKGISLQFINYGDETYIGIKIDSLTIFEDLSVLQEYNHQYYQIREDDGLIYIELSDDGEDWTPLASVYTRTMPKIVRAFATFSSRSDESAEFTNYLGSVSEISSINNFYYGDIPKVISDPSYNQDINAAGSSLDITIALPPDELPDYLVVNNNVELWLYYGATIKDETALQDQNGDFILDQNSDPIYGQTTTGKPDGMRKFCGFISKINRKYGDENTTISLLSHGQELDQYLLKGVDDEVEVISQDQAVSLTGTWSHRQTFSLSAQAKIDKITVRYSAPENASDLVLEIGSLGDDDTKDGDVIFWLSQPSLSGSNYTTFTLPEENKLLSQGNYYMRIDSYDHDVRYYYAGGDLYNGGTLQEYHAANDWSAVGSGNDAYMIMVTGQPATKVDYFSTDPSFIMFSAISNYQSQGGVLSGGEIAKTDTTVSYSFQTNTILEVINKVIELSPYFWWWSVDLANNTVNFKPLSTDLDHIFVLGRDINSLELTDSIEELVNDVYFSGGEIVPGVNLFIEDRDENSLAKWRQGLSRLSDSRVLLYDSAQLLADGEIQSKNDRRYTTSLVISAATYDTETIKVGQTVGFAGFTDPMVAALKLQIQSLNYTPDAVTIQLDTLPKPVSKRLEDLRRNMVVSDNQNNPDAPGDEN